MVRVTLWHEPQYFQFFIQDPIAERDDVLGPSTSDALEEEGVACGKGIVVVSVKSEYTTIPVVVEYDQEAPEVGFGAWDRVVECGLDICSNEIAFVRCPDGAREGSFGSLEVRPGTYRVRICFGGQSIVNANGHTGDHYAVQIWPSDDMQKVVLKT